MQGQELVQIDAAKAKEQDVYLMQRDLSYVVGDRIRHNPDAIAASIIQLICDDLKFKDMQNDTKYVLLNDRLKEAKKSLKENKKNDNMRKTKKKKERGKSKFFEKYQERINSIQESDEKLKVRKEQEEKEKQEFLKEVKKEKTKKK